MELIATADISLLFRLLIAHLLADFVFQSRSWIDDRHRNGIRSPYLYAHIFIVGLLTYLFMGIWSEFAIPLIIMITHLVIDIWKSNQEDTVASFVIDQATHIAVIFAVWVPYAGVFNSVFDAIAGLASLPSFWIVLLGYILVTTPSGYLISKITTRWQEEISASEESGSTGLKNAGMWIGSIERVIILTMILLNQYSAVGFLIAAKSIFRFRGNLSNERERKEAEYILIGTLLSFTVGILAGIAVAALKHWLPSGF